MSFQTQILRYTDQELASLIEYETATEALGKEADKVRRANYGNEVYVRGLIEFSNYCKNDCYYCGIRKGNRKADRYRLSFDDILSCCEEGFALGFRTFVLQVEKTRGTRMRKSVRLFLLLKNAFRNVPSRYRLEKNQKKAIRLISMPVQNAICFAMRQPSLNIIRNYTLTA